MNEDIDLEMKDRDKMKYSINEKTKDVGKKVSSLFSDNVAEFVRKFGDVINTEFNGLEYEISKEFDRINEDLEKDYKKIKDREEKLTKDRNEFLSKFGEYQLEKIKVEEDLENRRKELEERKKELEKINKQKEEDFEQKSKVVGEQLILLEKEKKRFNQLKFSLYIIIVILIAVFLISRLR
jgi:chromosome segregation ATPase